MSWWTKARDTVTGGVGTIIDPIGSVIGAAGSAATGSPVGGLLGGVGGAVNAAQGMLGGPKAPDGSSSVDYTSAANQDWLKNQQALAQQTAANRPTLNTPWGSQTWSTSQGTDPVTGAPITNWTGNINLSPEQQQAFDAQQQIQAGRSGAAQTLLGQASGAFDKPFDWDNLPPAARQAAQAGNVGQAQNAAYDQMRQMLQPGREQQQSSLDTKLANMGLSQGSTGNQRANMQLSDQWGAQDRQMMGQAMQQGLSNVQAQYGLDTSQQTQQQQLRQQAIAEQAQQRGMPLNELNALLSGQQVGMPQMPGFNAAGVGQPSQNLQAQTAAGQYQLGSQANQIAQQTDWGSLLGAAGSVGGAVAMGF